MSLRFYIITMTVLAVISDAILIPFYPQFFNARYGMDSAIHVGFYVAAISLAVMCTLPFWARLAKRIEPLYLLVYTQCAAGTFSVLSNWAPDVVSFWVLTMLMFMCKSSYLLMYPYMMRLTPKKLHASTIGILSVTVHFGAIFGAVVGGFIMQAWGPRACILAMAAGDFFQMFVCMYLIRSGKIVHVTRAQVTDAATPMPLRSRFDLRARLPILRLALVMLIFDFSAYLIRPFFSMYWQQVTGNPSELFSGAVFAIPGMIAVMALVWQAHLQKRSRKLPDHTIANLALGAIGLLLHAAPEPTLIALGRVLYGWALFQIIVKLEVNLFRLSTPQRYAQDYSITNFFQNLGVLLSSFAAGAIVSRYGLVVPFVLAAVGFILTALLDRLILKVPSAGHVTEAPPESVSLERAHAN